MPAEQINENIKMLADNLQKTGEYRSGKLSRDTGN